jgi:hypothetical protein
VPARSRVAVPHPTCQAVPARAEQFRQHGQVSRAVAQRRHLDAEDVQAVVEILAERPIAHQRSQVAVRGGDHAHIDRHGLDRADRQHLFLLQHTQQARLQRRRHIADLVEEQRAVVRRLEQAGLAAAPGARERPSS